eukprot:COSAG04_NODE_413_length_14740_cov_85.508572_17_plen_196_part_00
MRCLYGPTTGGLTAPALPPRQAAARSTCRGFLGKNASQMPAMNRCSQQRSAGRRRKMTRTLRESGRLPPPKPGGDRQQLASAPRVWHGRFNCTPGMMVTALPRVPLPTTASFLSDRRLSGSGCSGQGVGFPCVVTAKRVVEGRHRGHHLPSRPPEISPSQNLWGRRAVVRARRVKVSGAPWAWQLRALVRVPSAR